MSQKSPAHKSPDFTSPKSIMNNAYMNNPYKPQFYDRALNLLPFAILHKRAAEKASVSENESQATSTKKSGSAWLNFLKHAPLNVFVFFALIALITFGPGY